MPFFTVIIPSYNAGAFIHNTLDTILKQTYGDLEVIVVDGMSTDNTEEILKSYCLADERLFFVMEKDKGIYDAINKGIKQARGNWILVLGSDDQLYNSKVLEAVGDLLLKIDAELVYGNVLLDGDTAWGKTGEIYDGEFTPDKLFHKNICQQAIFYNKTVFKKIGYFNIDYKISADWDFNLRCFASVSSQYINMVVTKFLGGGESTVNNNDLFTSEDIVINLKRYFNLSYFQRLYKPYSWVFYNLAFKKVKEKKYFKSLYFLFFSIFHSARKISVLKNYFLNAFTPTTVGNIHAS